MDEKTLTSSKRIDTIDVLRGFALAGILYTHMIIWYTGAALPIEVYTKYDSVADGVAMGIFGGLLFGKFFSVFSFLFGLSFFLHFRKYRSKAGFPWVYLWRLFLLFLIGFVHHIFWRGDILAIYAILGIFLLLFRRLPGKFILIISLLLITNLPSHIYEVFQTEIPDAAVTFPMQEEADKYYSLVDRGGFLTVLHENWSSWPAKIRYQLESGRLLMTFGYFLLGFYAGRTKIFTSLGKHILKFNRWNKYAGRIALGLLLIGWLMYLTGLVTIPEINVAPEYKELAAFLFDVYNACVTVFYITGITILFRSPLFNSVLKSLAPMGRMALTNYLLQTFFGLMLFYNFGLGLFDKTSPALNLLMAFGILYLQRKFSQWWLQYFKQGPVEWLWKTLTYFKVSPIKKKQENTYQEIS